MGVRICILFPRARAGATYDTKEFGKDLFSAILNNCENDFEDLVLNDLYKKLCDRDFQIQLLKFISE